ncbi:NIPSNAP family protein [Limnoglobus roseus]|uniref:NIPSNAP family containing protein n=1 Tax=Limnoglobus roseus TaxID=2598579 RepID=A0A5C1ANG3_9BACT|nr:NIPSNAP family protein [Limnoglobus roseus]QEL20781.1 NIPSNAP family containing protein [Limnoglobus roseus]
MERRTFVGASLAALGTAATGTAAEPQPGATDLYEMRAYTLTPTRRPLLDEYLSQAYIPALKRLGVGPVGVFAGPPEKDVLRVYVLAVHKTADTVATLPAKLAADAEYQKAAAGYLNAKPEEPVYQRIESSLLSAIPGMPRLERPDATKSRLFNLRVYESHNERAAAKKVEMFEAGELAIFKRVGLTPVFFASAVAGAAMPNLTYLLVFPDEAGRKAAWDQFRGDPAWLKLKATPGYADKEIVSKITNLVLTPAAYSEI